MSASVRARFPTETLKSPIHLTPLGGHLYTRPGSGERASRAGGRDSPASAQRERSDVEAVSQYDTRTRQQQAHDEQEVVNLRHPLRWLSAAVVLALVVGLIRLLAVNNNIQWGIVGDYLFDGAILHAVLITLELSIIAQALGIVLGVVFAVMRLSVNPVLRSTAGAYVWFFRGTPQLVQLIFWFNLGILFPTLGIDIPFLGIDLSTPTNRVITPLTAAILGLGLNESAYYSEIVRAGVLSVPQGQVSAATALGMTFPQTMRKIVLPQAMRVIIPPTGNDFIMMLKTSSLVAVIGGSELLSTARDIYARSFHVIELLIVASIWYLVLTSVASVGQYFLERRFSRGTTPAHRDGVLISIGRNLIRWRRGRAAR
jgi:polar amino acid transport system permease protein